MAALRAVGVLDALVVTAEGVVVYPAGGSGKGGNLAVQTPPA